MNQTKSDDHSELDNHALLEAVVNDGSDRGESVTQNSLWENMQNYTRQRENSTGSVRPQGIAKHVTEIDFFIVFQ